MGERNSILSDASNAYAVDTIAIRGGGRVGVLVRKWRWSSEEGEKVSLRGSLTEPPTGKMCAGPSTPKHTRLGGGRAQSVGKCRAA
jgi:hypothetical protein